MQFENIQCPLHECTSCCYRFFHVNDEIVPLIRCITMYSSKEEMVANVYAEIIARYYMKNGKVEERKEKHYASYLSFYRRHHVAKSNLALRPVTKHRNAIIETNVQPASYVRPLVAKLTKNYLHEICGVSNYAKGSLVDRCVRILSWEDTVYEPFSYKMDFKGDFMGPTFPRVVFSTNNMTACKQVNMFAGFNKNTARRGESFLRLRRLLPNALKCMHVAIDTDKYVGKHRLLWDPRECVKWVNLNTGGGIDLLKAGVVEVDGVKHFVHDTGKKIFILEPAIRGLHKFIVGKINGEPTDLVDLEVIRQKQEWRKATSLKEEDLMKLLDKMREFFCPSLKLILFSHFLMDHRRKKETGKLIRIGMTFNWGGAYLLALYLHYDDDRFFWVDGDISQLDKNIQDWMLMLYVACGGRYFAWDDYDDNARECMEFFFFKDSHV